MCLDFSRAIFLHERGDPKWLQIQDLCPRRRATCSDAKSVEWKLSVPLLANVTKKSTCISIAVVKNSSRSRNPDQSYWRRVSAWDHHLGRNGAAWIKLPGTASFRTVKVTKSSNEFKKRVAIVRRHSTATLTVLALGSLRHSLLLQCTVAAARGHGSVRESSNFARSVALSLEEPRRAHPS